MLDRDKHLVYAEDIKYKLMCYPADSIPKYVIRKMISEVASEKEITIEMLMPQADLDDLDAWD
jgi:phage FluMu gp28-like protein